MIDLMQRRGPRQVDAATMERSMGPALELDGLRAGYQGSTIVRGISLALGVNEILAVVGRNGVGKTTLIKAIMGLLPATDGIIRLAGKDVTRLDAMQRARSGMGYVPQGRGIFTRLTVAENIKMGSLVGGTGKSNAEIIYEWFPILKKRQKQRAGTLSGGEQQMLAIGRALMTSPEIIMLDEPSLGLSPKFVDIVFEKLLSLRGEGMTVVMVEQKASHALGISDRGYVMHLGQVACAGTGADLLGNDDVKRLFLGEIPESMKALGLTDA
jgi:branched-chain amino acid transport system ATP-binding protein